MRRDEDVRYMHIDGKDIRCADDGALQYIEFTDDVFRWDGERIKCTAFKGNIYLYTGLEVKIIGRTGLGHIRYMDLYRLAKAYLEEMKTAYDPKETVMLPERRIPDRFI